MGKPKQPFDMGEYKTDKLDIKAWLWGMRNGVYISPIAVTEGRWAIVITINSVENRDPKTYTKGDIWPKVYEYYKYYYKKNENKI